jgi:hypothetical protein
MKEQPQLDDQLTRKLDKGTKFGSAFRCYAIAQMDDGRWGVVMSTVSADGKVKNDWIVCGQLEEHKEWAGETFQKELRYREGVQY